MLQLKHEMERRNAATSTSAAMDSSNSSWKFFAEGDTARISVPSVHEPSSSRGQSLPARSGSLKTHGLVDVCPTGNLRDSMLFDDMWSWCQSCKHGG